MSGTDWVGLCNPFAQTSGTMCSHCGTASSLKEFTWADSGENVMSSVRRMRKNCPLFWRMWFWWLGPLCGAAIIAFVMYFVGPHIPMDKQLPSTAWAAIGAFFGIFLMPFAVTPWLAPRLIGIEFHRQH